MKNDLSVHKTRKKLPSSKISKTLDRGSGRKCVTILGVKIDSSPAPAVLRKITVEIKNNRKFMIVTPNPEQIMLSQEDDSFKNILNKADIAIPDGIGLIASYRFLTLPRPKDDLTRLGTLILQGLGVGFSIIFDRDWLERGLKVIPGREMFMELINVANKNGWKVFFLGGEHGEANGTKKVLERNYKNLKIEISELPLLFTDGYPATKKGLEEEEKVVKRINDFSPDILFVGMTAPKQEKWTYRWLSKLNTKGVMMVGGTFRYISGQVRLPPKFVAQAGLEWLWRLLTGSQKGNRIWTAFPKFPLKIFLYKFNRK